MNHQDTSEVEIIPKKKKSQQKTEVKEEILRDPEHYYCASCGMEVPLGAHKETDPETGERHLLCLQCYLHKNNSLATIRLKKQVKNLEKTIDKLSTRVEKLRKTIEFIAMWEDIPL